MTNTDMDVEQIETNINREFSNTNKTQTQTQNLQTQTTQNQNQKETNNEKTFSTPKNLLNSTSLNLAQNKEEEFQLLINELKSNNMQIGEQEKKLVKKAHIKFLEEMELLKTDRDERLQEIQNWYDYHVTNLKNSFEFEKKQYQDSFEEEKKYLKQKILLDIKKKIQLSNKCCKTNKKKNIRI